jgi:DNA-binding transcriptional ArsR family regulator
MTKCSPRSKITCEIRCLAPVDVEAAARRLDPGGVERVSYTCQLSGETETLVLLGDDVASHLAESLSDIDTVAEAKILAGLSSAELCECDVATLTGLPEAEVISHLTLLEARGAVARRTIHGMNYFRLNAEELRHRIGDLIGGST